MADFVPYPSPYGFVQYRPLGLDQPVLSLTPSCQQIIAACAAVDNASYYYWYIGTTAGGEAAEAAQTTTVPTATFTELNASTTYYLTVKAFNQGVYSAASAEQSALPSCSPPPPSIVVGFVSIADTITPGVTEPAAVQVESGSGACSVDYATTDGTATAGVDYVSKSGTLTFGSSPQDINVTTMGPGLFRDFTITLSNPVGCTIDPSNITMTVTLVAS